MNTTFKTRSNEAGIGGAWSRVAGTEPPHSPVQPPKKNLIDDEEVLFYENSFNFAPAF